jgi:glycogen(starch) synthase
VKVLLTADTLGGVFTYALELCAALPEVTFVLAAVGAAPSRSQHAAVAELPNVTLESHVGRLEWMPDCERDLATTAGWLGGVAARHEPDLVHANGYADAALPWRVPVLLGAHSCVVSWWRAVHGGDPPPEWNRYRARVAAAVANADTVVAPTHGFLREFIALHGAANRAYTIYNGCRAHARDTAPRERMVLGAGRLWDAAKNVGALDDAAEGLEAPVNLAGPERAHGNRGVELRFARALGPLPSARLRRWMERAAIFASPVLYEPFGLAPLEAAHAGCALVLGDIPTMRELWQGAAHFVPPRDTAALFSPQRMADGYRAVYRELVPAWRETEVEEYA